MAKARRRRELARSGQEKLAEHENEELEQNLKALYRHCLLLNIQRGMDVMVPQDEFAAQECRRVAQEAKNTFLEVHGENPTKAPSQDAPELQYKINMKGRKYKGKYTSTDVSAADAVASSDAQIVDLDGERVLSAGLLGRQCEYTGDTGAALHVENVNELAYDEREEMLKLDQPRIISTANGNVIVEHYIEAQIQRLGGCRTFKMMVMDSPNLISIGQLVIEDGYAFIWNNKGPHLITPGGKLIWPHQRHNCPIFTSREQIE